MLFPWVFLFLLRVAFTVLFLLLTSFTVCHAILHYLSSSESLILLIWFFMHSVCSFRYMLANSFCAPLFFFPKAMGSSMVDIKMSRQTLWQLNAMPNQALSIWILRFNGQDQIVRSGNYCCSSIRGSSIAEDKNSHQKITWNF